MPIGRPKRIDRYEMVELECVICERKFSRTRYLEEQRVRQGKLGPVCSTKCSGKLGWKVKKSSLRESYGV